MTVAVLIFLWPDSKPDTTQVFKDQIARDQQVITDLRQQLSETQAKIKSDSLRQAKERKAYQEDVEKLEAVASKLKANPRVIYIRETEPAIDSLISYQDSVIVRQKSRIDTLELNLSDLRVDARKISDNFKAQIQAYESIRESQTQIISQQEKEIRKHKREKRLAIVGGIAAIIAALLIK